MASINFIRSILQILLSCFLLSNYNNEVEGGRRLISKEEDMELEKQLNLLNKPAIKSIQTKFGDIYDCVDFYKQPAFDHPLLKNHTFHPQMRLSSVPRWMRKNEHYKFSNNIGFKVVSCPSGTVPIRRVTNDDLIREKLYSERYGSKYNVLTMDNPGTHYAVVQTKFDPNRKYNGGHASIGTYNPSVGGSQYSSGRMRISNGAENIQIGWTVNPTLYGDNRTRLYIYFNAGQLRCFDTRCPGFVIVNSNFHLGEVIDVSSEGGPTRFIKFTIYRDAPVGNWWLVNENNTKVGFWPQKIFSSLAGLAAKVEWGGEVFSPPTIPSPQMGTGDFPKGSTYAAFCANMTVVNDVHVLVDFDNPEEYRDVDCYQGLDDGLYPHFGHVMYFGGPGGAIGN